MNEQKDKH